MVQNCTYVLSNFLDYKTFSYLSIGFVACFGIFLTTVKKFNILALFGYLFLLFGASIVAIDRIDNGCVSDYISFFGLFKYNIGDAMVTVGSCMLIYFLTFSYPERKKYEKQNTIS